MKVSCLYLPRSVPSLANAMYQTKWDTYNAKYFEHFLDDLVEGMYHTFSLELYNVERTIYACFASEEEEMHRYLTTGIYSFFDDCEIREVEDYTQQITPQTVICGGELFFTKPDIMPVQDYRMFAYDSMAPVISALNQIPLGDRVVVQVLVEARKDTLWNQFDLLMEREIEKIVRYFRIKSLVRRELGTKTRVWIEEKCNRKLSWINFRFFALSELTQSGPNSDRVAVEKRLRSHVQLLGDSMKVYNTTDENKFELRALTKGQEAIEIMQRRKLRKPYRSSSLEIASFWHPPTSFMLRNSALIVSKKAPPPKNLPSKTGDPQISFFGVTNYRDRFIPFGIRRFDRRLHSYIIGKSGSGKSCLLQLLIKNDIEAGFGAALLDPHGDLVDQVLKIIPEKRMNDVVIFDPSDSQFPPCFNPMNATRPDLKVRVTLSFLDAFQRVFGSDWSERMDHVLRYATMALLNVPGASVVSLRRILAEPEYRHSVLQRTDDESVRRFWEQEYVSRAAELEASVIGPLLNRFDQLLSSPLIKNILGQSQNLFNFREFMDSRKIVLMKVAKGALGVENATLLGSLLISKIYEAAMSRADMPQEERQDFYFYIDEFQNFANESFGEILSESRKYRLSLTMANQFLGQLSSEVRHTVFGNVGNLLTFRVGADDARTIAKEYQPRMTLEDILNLGFRDFYLKMSIDGQVQDAFSGRTIDVPSTSVVQDTTEKCRAISRQRYCIPVSQISQA